MPRLDKCIMSQSMTNGKTLDLEYAMWVLARPYIGLV